MGKFVPGLAVFVSFLVVGFFSVYQFQSDGQDCADSQTVGVSNSDDSTRTPSSFTEVGEAIDVVEKGLSNPKTFNPVTAASFINGFADEAYKLESVDFIPQGEAETKNFLERADKMADQLFRMRSSLSDHLEKFEKSGIWSEAQQKEAVIAFRRAHLYLRNAEDYLIEWHHHLKPLRKSATFFQGEGALTLAAPNVMGRDGKFQFKAGDVILVRGASFFSATIARIGDMPSNMSHIAMVAEAPGGELHVVEALLEKGMVSYNLKDYLKLEPLPRAAVYRLQNPEHARRSGQELWSLFQENLKKPVPFDVFMDPKDHSKIYCAELMAMAIERGTGGGAKVPRYQTSFGRVVETAFGKAIGLRVLESFAPADIEVDTRFRLLIEHRDLDMLGASRRFDVVLSRLFEMFEKGFDYRMDAAANLEATFGKFARTFGFLQDKVPDGVELGTLSGLIRHRNLVESLMASLEAAEKQEIQRTGRPLAYRELENLFNRLCGERCVVQRERGLASGRTATDRPYASRRCDALFGASR